MSEPSDSPSEKMETPWPPSLAVMNQLLPAFEFKSKVTSSPLGTVFLANQKSLDRQVAVKFFSPSISVDTEFGQAFTFSSAIAASLRHVNLISLFDSGIVGGLRYLVMEYVTGKSLARTTRGQITEIGQSFKMIEGICEGLAHAHDKGLVHGQLDTFSILLDDHGIPKIGSFGLGRAIHTAMLQEPPKHFLAPEVIEAPLSATKCSDVYSVAAIFYELITGQAFSSQAAPASTLTACSVELDQLILTSTHQDADIRPKDARDFLNQLSQVLGITKECVVAPNSLASKSAVKPLRTSAPALKVGTKPTQKLPLASQGPRTTISMARRTPTKPILIPQNKKGSGVYTKFFIIIMLLVAIVFVNGILKKTRASRDLENQQIRAKQEAAKAQKEAARALLIEEQALEMRKRQENLRKNNLNLENKGLKQDSNLNTSSLERLKKQLLDGVRSEMPTGTEQHGDRYHLIITEKMTWPDASGFAEKYGASLIDPTQNLDWLTKGNKENPEYWVGAGIMETGEWQTLEGKPLSAAPVAQGEKIYASIKQNGLFSLGNGSIKLSFIIEWKVNGEPTPNLNSIFSKVKADLASSSPFFPVGTQKIADSHYLYISRECDWKEAENFASLSGGHLLTLSTKEEVDSTREFIAATKAINGIWAGASLVGYEWQWLTSEPWQTAEWNANFKPNSGATALLLDSQNGWSAREPNQLASGFIVEWSKKSQKNIESKNIESAGSSLLELNQRMKDLIAGEMKKSADDYTDNVKKYAWDLSGFAKSLPSSGKQNLLKQQITTLSAMHENSQLSIDQIQAAVSNNNEFPENVLKAVKYHCSKQEELKVRSDAALEKIKSAYIDRLKAISERAVLTGQIYLISEIRSIIEKSDDPESWNALWLD